ncbi:MAG: tetraacyldisaccharide 4'-kinase [Acidobacteriaceae bacterium]
MNLRRSMLRPLVPMYAAIVSRKRRLFETGWLKSSTLKDAVISVGSVSAGGAGKTPMVLLIAEVLERRRYAVRILTRGYGRESTEVDLVNPMGDASRYGDEPVLLARRSGAPVFVGADRHEAGLMAEGMPAKRRVVHLLDDGFQHRQLARDLDIVLLTRKDVEDVLLPAGDLREPLSTLKRADVIVLREDEAEALDGFVSGLKGASGPPPIWKIRRRLETRGGSGGRTTKSPLAFCGIARPESFFGMLEEEGCRTAGRVSFADHQSYGERQIARLVRAAKEAGADGFVTTEKDAVKISEGMLRQMEVIGPVVVKRLTLELVDEKAALALMIAMAPRLNRRRFR